MPLPGKDNLVCPPIPDFLFQAGSPYNTYKPLSARAKSYFARLGFKHASSGLSPDAFVRVVAHAIPEATLAAGSPALDLRGLFNRAPDERHPDECDPSDPDGAPVGLPVRAPHRYERLGYTPAKWGERRGP